MTKSSKYTGVSWFPAARAYQASIYVYNTRIYVGSWRREIDAALARDRAILYLGLRQKLNLGAKSRKAGPASPDALRREALLVTKGDRSQIPFLGVGKDGKSGRFVASAAKGMRVGTFCDAEDAAVARDRVVLALKGGRAILNFPDRGLLPASVEEMRAWAEELRPPRSTIGGRRTGVRPRRWPEGYVGVGHYAGRFRALVTIDGRMMMLGVYDRAVDAAIAHDRVVRYLLEDRGPPTYLVPERPVAHERLDATSKLNFPHERIRAGSPQEVRHAAALHDKDPSGSRYRGVTLESNGRWHAALEAERHLHSLGRWEDEREAAIAVDRASLYLFGSECGLNFPKVSRARGPLSPAAIRKEAWQLMKQRKTSQYRGVSWDRSKGKWVAAIRHHYRGKTIGAYGDEEEAARAYDRAAKKIHKGKAMLNFPL